MSSKVRLIEEEEPILTPSTRKRHAFRAEFVCLSVHQFVLLGALTFPLIFQSIFSFVSSSVEVSFIGHLSSVSLSHFSLAISLFNVTGSSIIHGLASGLETIAGQAHGSKNHKLVGLTMQRAFLVCLVACIPIFALWWRLESLLLMANLDAGVAGGAAHFLHLLSPSLMADVIVAVLPLYLQSQGVVVPTTLCTVIAACACPFYCWFFIYHLDLGADGAAYAGNASVITDAFLLLSYVIYRDTTAHLEGKEDSTWPGISLATLFDMIAISRYLCYAVPAALMMVLEWWAYEILVIASGMVKEDETGSRVEMQVATMGIMINICLFFYLFPSCIGYGVNTRVANELGAGSAAGARRSMHVALFSSIFMQAFFILFLYFTKGSIAKVYTSDEQVIDLVASLIPFFCVQLATDGISNIAGGVLRGCGKQQLGALINLFTYWIFVLPLGLWLGLTKDLGAWGFWAALAAGMGLQCTIYSAVLLSLDWDLEVKRAQELVALEEEKGEAGEEGETGEPQATSSSTPLLIKTFPLRLSNDGLTSPHPHSHHIHRDQVARSPPIPSSATSLRMLHP